MNEQRGFLNRALLLVLGYIAVFVTILAVLPPPQAPNRTSPVV